MARTPLPHRRTLSPKRTGGEATRPGHSTSSATSLCITSPPREPAAVHYRQALALAEELGMRPLQAHCHRGLGTLYATAGQRKQARAALSAAVEMYRAMDMTFWLPQTEMALAQVEGADRGPALWPRRVTVRPRPSHYTHGQLAPTAVPSTRSLSLML